MPNPGLSYLKSPSMTFLRSSLPMVSGWAGRLRTAAKSHGSLGAIVANFAWLSGDRVARMGLQFLVGAVVARHLGPEGFGTLNVALAVTGVLGVFAALGFDAVFGRELLREPDRAGALMGTAFMSRLVAALLLYPVVAILALSQTGDTRASLLICGLMLFTVPPTVFYTYFEVHLQARYTVWAANAAFVLCTIVRIVLVAKGASIGPFAATYLIEPVIAAVVLYGLYRRTGGGVRGWSWEAPLALRLLKQSWPLMLGGLAIMIYMRIDQIMLAKMRGEAEVGKFCAALRLSEVWYFIPMALSSSLFPSLVRSRKLDLAIYGKRLGHFYDLNAALAYAIIVMMLPCAPWLFTLIFGRDFTGSATVFQIHLLACPFVFLGVARGQYLLNEGFTRFIFLSTVAGALANVGLNLLLIPEYGAHGAAVATVLSQAMSTLVSSFLWSPTRSNGYLQLRSLALPLRMPAWLMRNMIDMGRMKPSSTAHDEHRTQDITSL
jgi:polysaccharide transporter, PST family